MILYALQACPECGVPFANDYFDHEFGCSDRWVPNCDCGEEN